jgi:hypothetical protein
VAAELPQAAMVIVESMPSLMDGQANVCVRRQDFLPTTENTRGFLFKKIFLLLSSDRLPWFKASEVTWFNNPN